MGANYKHGVYSDVEGSGLTLASKSLGTIPVYIGTLPVQRMNVNGAADFDYSAYVGKPILVPSFRSIENMYSDDWATYSLCEAIHAHFLNEDEVIAPIILVNVLEPSDLAEEVTTATVTLSAEGTKKVGYIADPLASIEEMTITISGTELSDGDFSYTYAGDSIKIVISKEITQTSATVTYKKIAFTKDKVTDDKFGDALKALDMCEVVTGYIPNILAAPYFSSVPKLHSKMIQKAIEKIADKWNLIVASDIPCDSDVDTIDKAKTWKVTNEYNSKFEKVCYPKVMKGTKKYHLSTLATYTMQRTDLDNDNVPYVSPSNKVIVADSVVLEDGSTFFMKESEANELVKVGITTVNIIQRQLRLWGSHMGNYNADKLSSINYEDRSDCNIRMTLYLANTLQYEYIDNIDLPFNRKDIDAIKTSVQQMFNALVNEGKLLYATVEFNEDSNSEEDLANGDITFDIEYTLAPNTKSISFKLRYTNTGLATLTEGSDE